MRCELSEWAAIKPFLPNKPRGAPRVNDRRVLNGISNRRQETTRTDDCPWSCGSQS